MPLLAPYRRLLAIPGATSFWPAALIGRMPLSMVGLGLVLLVQSSTGSYAVAGTVTATYTVCFALCSVLHGRLIDRYGQGLVLRAAGVAFGLSMLLTICVAEAHLPRALLYLGAALTGIAFPQCGSAVRSRWTHLLDDPAAVQSALALESVGDEVVFIFGPVVTTVLATTVGPGVALGLALLAGAGGTVAFGLCRSTEPPVHATHHENAVRPPFGWLKMAPALVLCVGFGMTFGGYEVTTVAFASHHGERAVAGVLLAMGSLGSLVAALIIGVIRWRLTPTTRLRGGAFLLAVAMLPLGFIPSVWLLGGWMLIGGLAIAPTTVGLNTFTERVVPPARLNEGMAVLGTGIVAGNAPGSSITGWVIDNHGTSAAYFVCAAAAVVGALATILLPRTSNASR